MSKSSSKSKVSVGSALSLAAEVTKALSPIIRYLSQEQVDELRKNPLRLQEAFMQVVSGSGPAIVLQTDEGEFFIDKVKDEFGVMHEEFDIDLGRFTFRVTADAVSFGHSLTIETFLVQSDPSVKTDLFPNPIVAIKFEEVIDCWMLVKRSLLRKGILVPVERVWEWPDVGAKIVEEFVARNAVLSLGRDGDDLFVGLQIGAFYLETALSHNDARHFINERKVAAQS
jgi:hypothetical protein